MTTTVNLVRSSADPRKTVTLAAAAAMLCGLAGAVAPSASAEGCPDVELVFARGTGEPPGVGRVGQALIDTLTPMLGGRSLAVYPINYPASINFLTTGSGATDAENHLGAAAVACPATQFVLGGFSQGGALALNVALERSVTIRPRAIAAISPYLLHRDEIDPTRVEGIPALIVHGRHDAQVEQTRGRAAAKFLERSGAEVTWVDVEGGHHLGPVLLEPLGEWLTALDL